MTGQATLILDKVVYPHATFMMIPAHMKDYRGMNIPAIVISHNYRETMHKFSSIENGFINLGQYNKRNFLFNDVIFAFKGLINNEKLYKKLYKSMRKINFNFSRQKVKGKINKIEKIF